MSNGDFDRYTVKEILTLFVLPELARKADQDDVQALERDVRHLQTKILTPDSVAGMIGVALEKKDARGWTTKERAIAILGILFLAVTTLATVVTLILSLS
jgi:hypothetical protein